MGIFSHDEDPSWSDVIYYEEQVKELKAENDRLKEEKDGMQILIDNYITLTEKYHQTLQEIKEYAKSIGNEKMISGYAIRAKSALWQIVNKITKAEEE